MATATGWGALPISLSFGDSIKNLVAELNGPVAKAAKNAGGSIEKEIGNASTKAADQYEKQQWRMEKATKEKTAAEENHRLKLLEQQRAQTALENAEKDLADAREVGGKKARDAQLRYEAAQVKVEKATIATRKSSDKLDGSIDEVARATESAEQAFKDMEKAQEDSNKESSKMGGMFDDMAGKAGKLGGALKDVVGKVGPLAAGIAGAASIGEVISLGQEAAGAIGGLNRELGLTGDEARVMGDEVGEVLRSGVVGSAEEAAEAVGAIKAQFKDLSDEDISDIADNFAGFSQTFEIDMAEATQTAGQLMRNGLAGDAEEAADLMTAAMQRMPKAMRDELPELTNEYGTFFSSLGYSGEDMMGMFVNMSDQGKIAMDKLGDSLKEAGIRATDLGDSGAVEALEEIGLGADDIQNRLLAGGDTAKEAFQEMVGAIQSVEDPAERAEAAVALIGTPLEDLNKAELDGFLGTLSGGADAMEGFEGSSQELSDSIANSLQGRMDSLKGTVQDLAGDAFMYVWDVVENKVIPAVKDVSGWFSENADMIKSLAAGIGTAVGAFTLFTGAMKLHGIAITIADKGWKAYIASTKIATAVTELFNKATKANVIGLIATALIAVGGALVYFFTQTETGRALWEKFTNFLSDAWQKVSEKFAEGIDWISEKWNSFTSFMGELWGTIKTTVFDAWTNTIQGIRDGWDTFTGAISGGWTWLKDTLVNVWTTVRDAVFAVFIWYINRVKANFELVTGALSTAWTWLKDILLSVWATIRDAVFAAFEWFITRLKNAFELVTGAISTAWTWLKDMLVSVWNTIRDAVFTAFNNAVENVRAIFGRVTGAISGSWTWLKDRLHAGWTWIKENVFDAIGRGLDTVKGWFQTAVDGITRIWDKIRSAAAKPVKFVVDTVFNNGIRKAWNAVARFVGLDELNKVELGDLGNYASGGILPGYTPGRDPYTFIEPTTGMRIGLSGGEAIVRPEATRVLGSGWVDGVNAAAKTGGAAGVQKFLGGFANGGIVESISAAVRKQFPMMTITSTYRNTNDHHGAGRAVDFSNGTDSTPQMRAAAQWFYANYGPGLLELIHSPFNNNVKDGANVGDGFGFYGAGTMNQHRNHVHVAAPAPLGDPSVMVEMIEDAGGSGFSLSGMVKGLWDKAIGAVGKWTGGGLIGGLPGAMLSTLASSAWNFVSERVGKFFGAGGSVGNAESWREMAMAAMRRNGFNADDPAQVNAMLAQIMSESGGDPNIAQQIVDVNGTGESAGVGLLQIIPGTFAAHRDPELPDDRRDPWANMNAALRYYRSRYGTDLTTMWGKGHGYADGGIVDLPKLFDKGGVWRDGTMGVNLSGSDEVVFNNRQWQLLKQVLNTVPMLTDSQEMMVKEIGAAFLGGDVGYAELANALGSEKLAQQVTDIAFLLGEVSRDTEVMAAAAEFNEQARKSAEDYAAEQASGLLSIFGLEGLVPLAQKAGGMAWDAYVANPVDVAMTPNGVTAYARKQGVHAEVNRGGATVTIEAESDEDLIRVSQFKQLASQVDWLKVKVERKPKAGARTRGGVM